MGYFNLCVLSRTLVYFIDSSNENHDLKASVLFTTGQGTLTLFPMCFELKCRVCAISNTNFGVISSSSSDCTAMLGSCSRIKVWQQQTSLADVTLSLTNENETSSLFSSMQPFRPSSITYDERSSFFLTWWRFRGAAWWYTSLHR